MSGDGASIVCERLTKLYRVGSTDVTALAGLDLRVSSGEMVGIIGPSGCGKSTLMNIIGALSSPTSGMVEVDGHDLAAMNDAAADRFRRRHVGFVWQDTTRNLIPYLDATANVMVPLRLDGASNAKRKAHQLLTSVGLGDRLHHRPNQLSGGQQQRVAIAVALANTPSLLLADEPTGELDGRTAAEVYALLQLINREHDITTVIVSHDPNMASVVDRVVELRDGQSAAEHHGTLTPGDQDRAVLLVDTVGRIRMPDGFRERLGIGERVEARIDDGKLTLEPYELDPWNERGDDK